MTVSKSSSYLIKCCTVQNLKMFKLLLMLRQEKAANSHTGGPGTSVFAMFARKIILMIVQ